MTKKKWLATGNVAFYAFFIIIGCRHIIGADFLQAAIEASVITLFSCIAYMLACRTRYICDYAHSQAVSDVNFEPVLNFTGLILLTSISVIAACALIGWLFAGVFTSVALNFVYGWVVCVAALHAVPKTKRERQSK